MPDPASKAIFLSYASQDVEAARRIADALVAAGIEVWFDQSELVGGDQWDAKIRGQIGSCALFVPVISASTQARLEGYFRIEWKLAAQRTHAMAEVKPFLLPVVIDATRDTEAHVPGEFRAVQWAQLPAGETPPDFCQRVSALLSPAAGTPRPFPVTAGGSTFPADKSIAVLAFANLSRDPDNEYFSDGISEELLNVLAKVPNLRVAARTSAFFFKGRNVPVPEIARTLGVAHVVEGSVRKSGNRVRITAQLIDARNGFHLWSDNFDRELQDIFAVQDEIAGLIAQNLQLKLGEGTRKAQAVNPEVHRLILEGRYFWNQRNEAGFARAEQAFGRALEIDPDFAAAHSGLADVRAVRAWYMSVAGLAEAKGHLQLASSAAKTALQLDPTMAGAHATLAVVSFQENRLEDAEQQFQQALQLNENFALGYHWHAHLLSARGRLAESLAELERSIALDPLATSALVIYATHLNFAQRYEEALALADRSLALGNRLVAPIHGTRAMAFLGLGRNDEALGAARLVGQEESIHMRWWAGEEALHVMRQVGSPNEADEQFRAWQAALPANSPALGHMLHAIGRFEEALPYLRRTSPTIYARLYFQAIWDDVRENPLFLQLLKDLNCEQEYRIGRDALARMLRERQGRDHGVMALRACE